MISIVLLVLGKAYGYLIDAKQFDDYF